MKEKVNLLIIGTQKAGTTSLFYYLNQHPDVYFSEVKEVNYFAKDVYFNKGVRYYHSFFPKWKGQRVIASSYVHMLPNPKCAKRVQEYNGDMRFIVMLRDPIKRAISAYNYAIRNNWEDGGVSFMEAFRAEPERLKVANPNYDITYFYNGLYYQHLAHWFEYFPQRNFLIIRDSDLRRDSKGVLDSIFDFLGVDRNVVIDTSKNYNEAGEVRSTFLQGLFITNNPVIIKTLRFLLPRSAKLWVLTRFLPWMRSLNTKKTVAVKKESNDVVYDASVVGYFKEDLEKLKVNLNIEL
ncbi:MAG: sulfotransferase [Bacteroidota bacterium]